MELPGFRWASTGGAARKRSPS
uniref:Uncharacterized protein n=1 Tax=Arundo donax TaxID=35708 RepID=A0A0A9BCN6_ARUDO